MKRAVETNAADGDFPMEASQLSLLVLNTDPNLLGVSSRGIVRRAIDGLVSFVVGVWSYGCIILLVGILAPIPIVQFVSFGYMLECSARMSRRLRWSECFPGQRIARRIVLASVCIGLSWLPVWYIADLAYTAELIDPGCTTARNLRIAARVVSFAWVGWIAWALFRGGRLRDFLWPAPWRFLKTIGKSDTWRQAEDQLWGFVTSLRLGQLGRLGLMASLGAIIWMAVPAALMIYALAPPTQAGKGLLGVLGVLGMLFCVSRIPYLQVHYATTNRWQSLFDLRKIKESYRRSPLWMVLGLASLLVLSVPLYLLRIEPILKDLDWILTTVFVFLLLPAHAMIGWTWGRAESKPAPSHRLWRWSVWPLRIVLVLAYVGILYLARFASWEGSLVFLLQHATLPPVPFFAR
jgi:hypothetical protein